MLLEALAAPRVVLSVVGPHAGEGVDGIFTRKIDDVRRCGATLWLCRSPAARPDRVRGVNFVLFLAPKHAARATTSGDRATETSSDRENWKPIPMGLSPVTGNLRSGAYALVLSSLALYDGTVDLRAYGGVRFALGRSTLVAEKRPGAMQVRQVVAVGQLVAGVWVR